MPAGLTQVVVSRIGDDGRSAWVLLAVEVARAWSTRPPADSFARGSSTLRSAPMPGLTSGVTAPTPQPPRWRSPFLGG